MKHLLFALACGVLTACSNGGGGASTAADPVYGEWYYEAPGSTYNQSKGIVAALNADGTVNFSYYYAQGTQSGATFYTRKSVGTFERNGSEFKMTYSYETCQPVKAETLHITHSGNSLIVQTEDRSVSFQMSKITSLNIKNMAVIEDKNCNILSKLENSSKRIPANSAKSFLKTFQAL